MAALRNGGGSTRQLYAQAPEYAIEDFSRDFIVRDFMKELSDKAIPVNRRSGTTQEAFDPKPLIRVFESMLHNQRV